MAIFKKVAIVGVGLIGGSIALALKKKHLAKEIVGVCRHKNSIILAKKNRVIDKGSCSLEIIRGADLIILATPVGTIKKLSCEIAKIINPRAIVTDVGSTKEEISLYLNKIFPRFIPTHPLAGSEKRGVSNACDSLFKDTLCIITPVSRSDRDALIKIKRIWASFGAKIKLLTPKQHDILLANISHLPHALAFSLINSMPERYLGLAPNSLKDMTRIASSDASLWVDIFLSNRNNLIKSIDSFSDSLNKLKCALGSKDRNKLKSFFCRAGSKRRIIK